MLAKFGCRRFGTRLSVAAGAVSGRHQPLQPWQSPQQQKQPPCREFSVSSASRHATALARAQSHRRPSAVAAAAAAAAPVRHSSSASLETSSDSRFGDPADRYFGVNSFDIRAMRMYLSPEVCERFQKALRSYQPVPSDLADAIAIGLKSWAQDRGVTHYTHWFQPINNAGGEKHDTFLDLDRNNQPLNRFTGKELSVAEPDGSSFPSGGLRDTSHARGYTVWDPSSPPFVYHHSNGATLYLPSVFVSWEVDPQTSRTISLDEKLPQMRSGMAARREMLRLLQTLNPDKHRPHQDIKIECGIEQEFFIVHRDKFVKRPDLISAGRTILGAPPPRGQELDDSYFGHQTRASLDCVHAFEVECWKLGIPVQTRHREVAPGQYEVAPKFSDANVAADRNLLMMDILRDVCMRHDCAALLHEKPFAGLNGSGKHNNWSVGTDLCPVLFQQPKTQDPRLELEYMASMAAFIRGVDMHPDVLRVSVASANNDHRLGMQEAPPAIISVSLGDDIASQLQAFARTHDPDAEYADTGLLRQHLMENPEKAAAAAAAAPSTFARMLDLGAGSFPVVSRDTTDRNRTSPIAFIGNRFEFRAVGSSQNVCRSTTALNIVLADGAAYLADQIQQAQAGVPADDVPGLLTAARRAIARTLRQHQRVIFDGNGYSAQWQHEAVQVRGLPNLATTALSLAEFPKSKNISLFQRYGVFSERELYARHLVYVAEYLRKICIEGRLLLHMFRTGLLPPVVEYSMKLQSVANAEPELLNVLERIGNHRSAGLRKVALLESLLDRLDNWESAPSEGGFQAKAAHAQAQAEFLDREVVPLLRTVRQEADALELLMPAESYPWPTYHDMLYSAPN